MDSQHPTENASGLVPKPGHDDTASTGVSRDIAGSSVRGKHIWGSFTNCPLTAGTASGQFLAGESDRELVLVVREGWKGREKEKRTRRSSREP